MYWDVSSTQSSLYPALVWMLGLVKPIGSIDIKDERFVCLLLYQHGTGKSYVGAPFS